MIVTCERCSARYKLDDNKIKGRGARITCPKCKHVFVVLNKGQEPELDDPEEPSEEPEEPEEPRSTNPLAQDPDSASGLVGTGRRADQLDFRKVGISTWKVKVKIGLVYDFSDIGTLRKYIQDRRVTEDDVISHDGGSWVRIGDIPDLDQYFLQVYEELEEQLTGEKDEEADTGESFGEEDGPTMVVGMGSLRSNISTGVFQRPRSKVADATRSLPDKPSAPGPDPNRFVDPFESLKERQRDRMRAKRREGAVTTGTHRKGGANGKGKGKGKSKVNPWLVAAALVAVALVVWFFFLRVPGKPVQVNEPEPVAHQRHGPDLTAEERRQILLDQLEAQLQEPSGEPNPIEVQGSVEEGLPTVITPEVRAQLCREGRLTGDQCKSGAGQSGGANPGVQQPTVPAGVTQQATTPDQWAAAGVQSARNGNWSEAATNYQKAVNGAPRNAVYLLGLATAQYKLAQHDAASASARKSLDYGNESAKKVLGLALIQVGDDIGGKTYLREYNQKYPGDPEVQAALQ